MTGKSQLVSQIATLACGTKDEAVSPPQLTYPMSPMEGNVFIPRHNADTTRTTAYTISGIESMVPGGAYHFITTQPEVKTLAGQTRFGGAIWFNKEKAFHEEHYPQRAAVALAPQIASGKNDTVDIMTPFLSTMDPTLRAKFLSSVKVLNILYVDREHATVNTYSTEDNSPSTTPGF